MYSTIYAVTTTSNWGHTLYILLTPTKSVAQEWIDEQYQNHGTETTYEIDEIGLMNNCLTMLSQ